MLCLWVFIHPDFSFKPAGVFQSRFWSKLVLTKQYSLQNVETLKRVRLLNVCVFLLSLTSRITCLQYVPVRTSMFQYVPVRWYSWASTQLSVRSHYVLFPIKYPGFHENVTMFSFITQRRLFYCFQLITLTLWMFFLLILLYFNGIWSLYLYVFYYFAHLTSDEVFFNNH